MEEGAFAKVHRPQIIKGHRVPALRFGDPRVLALLCALVVFRLLPRGFTNADLREHVAPLLGLSAEKFSSGRMTYDLRRLRLHGFIERVPESHRYRITEVGMRQAVFLCRAYARLLRPGLGAAMDSRQDGSHLSKAFCQLDTAIERMWEAA